MSICHCGQPLHYRNPETERMVNRIIAVMGEYVTVVVNQKRYKIPRHYIALHGLKGAEISALGFEEVS